MKPLLCIIPYWKGDSERLPLLCQLLAGLEEHPTRDVEILMLPRQDCQPDVESEAILRKRFHVGRLHSPSPQRDYPGAVNGMFFAAYLHLSMYARDTYETTLWMEPDMCPLRRNWWKALLNVWAGRQPNIYAMGHIFQVGGTDGRHLNGGALWSQDIVRIIPDITTCNGAWDWANRDKILRFAQPIEEIHYWHHVRNVITYPRDAKTVVIHGCKDDSLVRLVAKSETVPLD